MGRKTASALMEKTRFVSRRTTFRQQTLEACDALKERLAREAPELAFDLDALVDDLAAREVAKANRELDARKGRRAP